MRNRLSVVRTIILATLLMTAGSGAFAQHYGGWRGGGWYGGGGRGYHPAYGRGYVHPYGYYGYRPYYGGYDGYHYHNDAWIAVGAGLLGAVLGSVIAAPPPPPRVYYYYYPVPAPAPAPAAPAMHQCPDGSTIPAGSYCPAAAAPAPPPVPAPQRGERG